ASKGSLTWRWLAYLLEADANVEPIRRVIRQRLMDAGQIQGELKRLTRMLVTLHEMEVVVLDPPPPQSWRDAVKPKDHPSRTQAADDADDESDDDSTSTQKDAAAKPGDAKSGDVSSLLGQLTLGDVTV